MIAVFDSGLGGLTVVSAIRKRFPAEDIVYLGDTARLPYGTRSQDLIEEYSWQNVQFLQQFSPRAIVIACNSASAWAEESLQQCLSIPVLGVIDPAVRIAAKSSKTKHIGVIGTQATVRSGKYPALLAGQDDQIEVHSQAAPLLVPLVEEGWIDKKQTYDIIKSYLQAFAHAPMDVLILACTHYPLLKHVFRQCLASTVQLIDSAEALAEDLQVVIPESQGSVDGRLELFVSDWTEHFECMARRFFSEDVSLKLSKHLEKV